MSDIEDNISETSDTSHIPEQDQEAPGPAKKGKKKRSQENTEEDSQISQMHQPMNDEECSQLSTRMGPAGGLGPGVHEPSEMPQAVIRRPFNDPLAQ